MWLEGCMVQDKGNGMAACYEWSKHNPLTGVAYSVMVYVMRRLTIAHDKPMNARPEDLHANIYT